MLPHALHGVLCVVYAATVQQCSMQLSDSPLDSFSVVTWHMLLRWLAAVAAGRKSDVAKSCEICVLAHYHTILIMSGYSDACYNDADDNVSVSLWLLVRMQWSLCQLSTVCCSCKLLWLQATASPVSVRKSNSLPSSLCCWHGTALSQGKHWRICLAVYQFQSSLLVMLRPVFVVAHCRPRCTSAEQAELCVRNGVGGHQQTLLWLKLVCNSQYRDMRVCCNTLQDMSVKHSLNMSYTVSTKCPSQQNAAHAKACMCKA